jgi:nitroreductase
MTILDIVKHRRSIRQFLDRPVERDKIMMCLEAARLAPSAVNSQPWKFIVVDDPAIKKKLCDVAFSGVYSINAFAKKAPVIVVVVSERANYLAQVGGIFRDTRYYLIDVGIATEHFVLQAEELGLGTCWMGWFDEQAVKKVLHIPKDKKLYIVVAVGYYEQKNAEVEHNRQAFDKIVSFNSY